MIKLFAIAALFLGFVAIESSTPETATLLSDTGAWAFDTGSEDTGSEDTGSEDTGMASDPADTGATTDTGGSDDASSPTDTGAETDTGHANDTGSDSDSTAKYSAAQLANESGGCSTGGALNGPWALALLLCLVRRRRG